jgi:uncharacterized protein (UPF0548 family)
MAAKQTRPPEQSGGFCYCLAKALTMDILLWFMGENPSRWEVRPVARGTRAGPTAFSFHDAHRRIVAVEPPGPALADGPFQRAARAIRHYDIFPPDVGRGCRPQPVQVGDSVGLRYRLIAGLHLYFASRVTDVFDGPQRSGFTYQTLQGHPENGEETFAVDKDPATGAVRVSLEAWSELALPLAGWLRPLARWVQVSAGRRALDHLERRANSL